MRRWIFKCLVLLIVLAGFLGGLIVLGQWAFEQIRHQDRYTMAFADIDCTPPPGLERVAFLDEVQYHALLPGRLCLLEEDLARRLADGFRKHPWVAKVAEVELSPPCQVRVQLCYRKPVLAVRVGKKLRAVDDQGVLLPPQAMTEGLPVFSGTAAPPAGPAGTSWGDAAVEALARSLQK